MPLSKLLQMPSTRTLWCLSYVIFLTICASALPVNYNEDYDSVYGLQGDDASEIANILKREDRRAGAVAAPMWFHRNGRADAAPLWFNRFGRDGEIDERNAKTPPLWFHRAGRGSQVAAPLWFHRGGRSFQKPLSYKEKELIKDMLRHADQRSEINDL